MVWACILLLLILCRSNYVYQKGKMIVRHNAPNLAQAYLNSAPLTVPCVDKGVGEYYLWHGNYNHTINTMCDDQGIGLNFRNAILSGCGGKTCTRPIANLVGLFFSENSSQANIYVPCTQCGRGSLTFPETTPTPCACQNQQDITCRMLLCR